MKTTPSGTSKIRLLLLPAMLFLATPVLGGDMADPHSGGGADCVSCHQNTAMAPSETAAPVIATHRDFLCTDCHDSHGETSNLHLVKEVILTPSSGAKDVLFLRKVGINSYADGDTTYDGICEVCHTTTKYHRNNHTANHFHYAAWQCVNCHPHDNGFDPLPVTSVIDSESQGKSVRVYPSPSRGAVTVMVSTPSFGGDIHAAIWDVNGRVVRRLESAGILGGQAVFRWDGIGRDGAPARSGVYFCVVDAEGGPLKARFVLLR